MLIVQTGVDFEMLQFVLGKVQKVIYGSFSIGFVQRVDSSLREPFLVHFCPLFLVEFFQMVEGLNPFFLSFGQEWDSVVNGS